MMVWIGVGVELDLDMRGGVAWRHSHTRTDYEGTWQREVITTWSTSTSYLSAPFAVVRC
jgi:hypothetical protein